VIGEVCKSLAEGETGLIDDVRDRNDAVMWWREDQTGGQGTCCDSWLPTWDCRAGLSMLISVRSLKP